MFVIFVIMIFDSAEEGSTFGHQFSIGLNSILEMFLHGGIEFLSFESV